MALPKPAKLKKARFNLLPIVTLNHNCILLFKHPNLTLKSNSQLYPLILSSNSNARLEPRL